jgi:HEAT repeat protein
MIRQCLVAALAIWACTPGEETTRLIRAAQSKSSANTRQDACVQLGERGDTTAVQALIGMLEDQVLEWCAARSLGQLRDPRAIPALRAHVRLRSGGMNRMAVWALGEIGDSSALSTLDSLQRGLTAERAVDSMALDSVIAKLR